MGCSNGKAYSIDALEALEEAGYENLSFVRGGYNAWFRIFDNKLARRNYGEYQERYDGYDQVRSAGVSWEGTAWFRQSVRHACVLGCRTRQGRHRRATASAPAASALKLEPDASLLWTTHLEVQPAYAPPTPLSMIPLLHYMVLRCTNAATRTHMFPRSCPWATLPASTPRAPASTRWTRPTAGACQCTERHVGKRWWLKAAPAAECAAAVRAPWCTGSLRPGSSSWGSRSVGPWSAVHLEAAAEVDASRGSKSGDLAVYWGRVRLWRWARGGAPPPVNAKVL